MVAAPLSVETGSARGPRPINLGKDVPQVLALLNLVFSPSMGPAGRRALRTNLTLSQQPWIYLRFRQMAQGIVPGFVWEESGDIVGNVSLLTTSVPGRYLVANVAVHPNYRRRGIARTLLEAVLNLVTDKGGETVLLQVDHDNEPAITLYDALGFSAVGSMTTWRSATGRLRPLSVPVSRRSPDHVDGLLLRPLRRDEWRMAWRLDQLSLAPDLNWPEPVAEDAYKRGLLRWLADFLNGRRRETWVARNEAERMVGLVTILSEWGRAHVVNVRVLPAWQGRVERPLLAKALRRLKNMARRKVEVEHPAGDDYTGSLLQAANFQPRRTLTIMRYNVSR